MCCGEYYKKHTHTHTQTHQISHTMTNISNIGVLLSVVVLFALYSSCYSQTTIAEPYTQWSFDSTYNSCPHTEGGHIDAIGWTYAAFVVYECNTPTEKTISFFLKVYTSWITNYVYRTAFSDLLESKNDANEFIFTQTERDAAHQLVESITDTLYSGNEIRITSQNGVASITLNGDEKSHTSMVTFDTIKRIIPLFGSVYIKTL